MPPTLVYFLYRPVERRPCSAAYIKSVGTFVFIYHPLVPDFLGTEPGTIGKDGVLLNMLFSVCIS